MSVPSLNDLDAKIAQHIAEHGPLSKMEGKYVTQIRDLVEAIREWTE